MVTFCSVTLRYNVCEERHEGEGIAAHSRCSVSSMRRRRRRDKKRGEGKKRRKGEERRKMHSILVCIKQHNVNKFIFYI